MPSAVAARVTPVWAMRAEWVKFGTLISNPLTMFVAFPLIAGLAVLLVWARSTESTVPTMTELLTGASWAQCSQPFSRAPSGRPERAT